MARWLCLCRVWAWSASIFFGALCSFGQGLVPSMRLSFLGCVGERGPGRLRSVWAGWFCAAGACGANCLSTLLGVLLASLWASPCRCVRACSSRVFRVFVWVWFPVGVHGRTAWPLRLDPFVCSLSAIPFVRLLALGGVAFAFCVGASWLLGLLGQCVHGPPVLIRATL